MRGFDAMSEVEAVGADGHTEESNCLNCGALLTGEYCQNCGHFCADVVPLFAAMLVAVGLVA